jgi:hypothetical protein
MEEQRGICFLTAQATQAAWTDFLVNGRPGAAAVAETSQGANNQ